MAQEATDIPDGEEPLSLDDFQQGWLAGWISAQGWGMSPTPEQYAAAARAWEAWLDSRTETQQ